MNNNKLRVIFLIAIILIPGLACKKYLAEKTDKSLVIPSNLTDLQALLDNYRDVNEQDPSGGEVASDNYYLTDDDWNSLYENDMRLLYTWQYDHLFASINNMWNNVWQPVYIANVVLDNLPEVERSTNNRAIWDNIKGQALYIRGKQFHLVACTWALAYDSLTSQNDLGIPLRLHSDFNLVSKRANNMATYDQIIKDLSEAARLLPVTSVNIYRASKPAAYALLSRVYLSMRNYNSARKYSDSCLQLYNSLMDYNVVDSASPNPFSKFTTENIAYGFAGDWGPLGNSVAKIDSGLYNSYDRNDLRKSIFFEDNGDGSHSFKGNYSGISGAEFTGPAVDEMYLTRAECYARMGNTSAAMNDLNKLMIKRWRAGAFIPFSAGSADEALQMILKERRKELIYRELRWMDIKRLNREGSQIVLKRIVGGQQYVLEPNSPRFALPIPEDVINLTGMPQNPK